ncbi:hypothetical protein NEOLI_005503 [Neolecta irregularis DAH-3]|uniref:Uncharacterized protein n=1 Tax=Neolecta irregularis (strain DAH-3) TaxID=1198029 RepID=A0A1U7LW38_NEOID|nr:hypothetical protein NEOLI_005503 [Neolecta irregularis DAH-3]|eukprot:OLL26721.1 hypothetical protein NEOLI_005503 [Neolecta irregularis DAH-3]
MLLCSTSLEIPASTAPVLGFVIYTANLFHSQKFTKKENDTMGKQLFASGMAFLAKLKRYWGPLDLLYENLLKCEKQNYISGFTLPTPVDVLDSTRVSISNICDIQDDAGQTDLLIYLSHSGTGKGDLLELMERSVQQHHLVLQQRQFGDFL